MSLAPESSAPRSRPGRGRRGANAIEFAMTLPLFLMILLGLMDYGYLFSQQAQLDNAVSLACREGALSDPSRLAQTFVANREWTARSAFLCSSPGCSFTPALATTGDYLWPNQALQCTGSKTMSPLTGFVPYPTAITTTSYYRLEWQQAPEG